jgi:GNAT superfamily N-acetyltransferase
MGVEVSPPSPFSQSSLADRARIFAHRIEGRLRLGLTRRAISYGLRRDLAVAVEHPSAKIPISVRPMKAADLGVLLPADTSSLDPDDRIEVAWRVRFAGKFGLDGGFVAIDERSGQPCYMQWLLGPERNEEIARLRSFPRLAEGEALLENAYTPARHRGLGIMSAAMAQIAERGAETGARSVLTFVGRDNPASLKGCRRAGFSPDMVHTRRDLAFGLLRSDRFETLAPDDPRRNWQL